MEVSSWSMDLYGICYGEYISAYGKQIPASSIGERYNDGMHLVCLPSNSYALPPPPLGTSADAGNQQRGREGGVVAPTTTVSSTITHPASQGSGSAPSPTQDGLASNCNNFASVKGGDTCFDRAKAYGITPEQLYACKPNILLHPYFIPKATDRSQQQGIRYWDSTEQTAPPNHARHRPGPTQSGIDPNCNKYAPAQKGDVCDTFAARSSISNAQLYAWNAALGSSGQNCGSSLWADEWYCVGISAPAAGSTASSSKITRVTAPGPT
ncbi:hypothetical protein PG996_001598 [Apiospora saccharicola]|uniref:LysM domain-containing protein n=1 Tax=Apiospora saccharicola TaxID=335842 RepID=A0ABR1WH50_9PEZI